MQNRVDPFGNIITTKARGLWMGNRGKIHNDEKQITHAFKLKAWLICRLEFNGRHRQLMGTNTYTELFFLDEATAFAAGHRPCFECRRNDFMAFKSAWLKANPKYGFTEQTSIQKIDEILHKERINEDGTKHTYQEHISNMPGGSFISLDNIAYLVFNNELFLWTPFGYKKQQPKIISDIVKVLTPSSVVNMFRGSYLPQINL